MRKYIRTIWETSHRCCIMRKVIHKEVTAGGRFDFFLDSAIKCTTIQLPMLYECIVSEFIMHPNIVQYSGACSSK